MQDAPSPPDEQPSGAASWELSKENYVPVKSGRNHVALEELTDVQHARQALERRRQ